jgi:hypothetical protein
MTDPEKLDALVHKLNAQRQLVQSAHGYFHEWANSKGGGIDVQHAPEEEFDPAALMRRIVGWYEERMRPANDKPGPHDPDYVSPWGPYGPGQK